jgi:sugar-specific transcriptional regulator TrmB
MSFCEEIKKEVINKAISLIKSSKKIIEMTMNMEEELVNPLPQKYHGLLKKLVKKNIKISRYTYGDKKLVSKIKDLYPQINIIYSGNLNKYQRMLIIDRNYGLFSINGKVFFTNFKPLIKSLLEYAKIK